MYKLNTNRFGDEFVFRFDSLRAAANEALRDMERNWAYPISIETEKGKVVWRNIGNSSTAFESLQKFSSYV